MTGRRAVAVAPEDRMAESLAACAQHCIDKELVLTAVAPDVHAALEMLFRGEVDVVVLPGDDGTVPVQVAGHPYRRPADLPAPRQRSADVVPAKVVTPVRRRPRRMHGRA